MSTIGSNPFMASAVPISTQAKVNVKFSGWHRHTHQKCKFKIIGIGSRGELEDMYELLMQFSSPTPDHQYALIKGKNGKLGLALGILKIIPYTKEGDK